MGCTCKAGNLWAPEYPIVDKVRLGTWMLFDGGYLQFYYRTERKCRNCGKFFVRGEFPPEFRENSDFYFGKDLCGGCADKELLDLHLNDKRLNKVFLNAIVRTPELNGPKIDYFGPGMKNGLTGKRLSEYVQFMLIRFLDNDKVEHAEEWARTFRDGKELERADLAGRIALNEINPKRYPVKKGQRFPELK